MTDDLLRLYQAEWCPYSRRVRQRLTELGVPFVALQVAAEPERRSEMRAATGTEEIPAAVLPDGTVLAGDADEIVSALDGRFEEDADSARHREEARAHHS
jgi:glutathione S-transferase